MSLKNIVWQKEPVEIPGNSFKKYSRRDAAKRDYVNMKYNL
jgi:hypothetical protein